MSSENHTTVADNTSTLDPSSEVVVKPSADAESASELRELIFLDVPYHILIECSQVSPLWQEYIGKSMELQRLLYKIPVAIPENDPNPHFEDPMPRSANTIIPHGIFKGKPLLATSQKVVTDLLEVIGKEDEEKDMYKKMTDFRRLLLRIREGYMGVRARGSGWPRHLQKIFCECCRGFHAKFRHMNLHPLLRFLEDVDVCWQGSGGKLYVDNRIMVRDYVRQSCWEHYLEMYLLLARNLKHATDFIRQHHLENDLISKPLITNLFLHIERKVEVIELHSSDGVRLQEAVNALIFQLRGEMDNLVGLSATKAPEDHVGGSGPKLDRRLAFPKDQDVEDHKKRWPDLVKRFAEVHDEIKDIFQGIEAWDWERYPQ